MSSVFFQSRGCAINSVAFGSFRLARRTLVNIGVMPGDGIGKEVIPAAQRVMEAVAPGEFFFKHLDAGFGCFLEKGTAMPQETLDYLSNNCKGALFGATESPTKRVENYYSPIVQLRNHFKLYANVRPISSPETRNGKSGIDMVVVREGTECLYIKSERTEVLTDGTKVAWAERKITETGSRNIGQFALDLALKRHESRKQDSRPKVTVVHKSNVLSQTDGLFRETILSLAKSRSEYMGIHIEEQIVDSMIYNMIRTPEAFDVIVAPNLYGDIISDCGAALVGSLGLVASANVGSSLCLGEPVHGSAPQIAGKGISNPIAAIRSAALLLEHMNYTSHAQRIQDAVNNLLVNHKSKLTPDLNGKGTTESVTRDIISLF